MIHAVLHAAGDIQFQPTAFPTFRTGQVPSAAGCSARTPSFAPHILQCTTGPAMKIVAVLPHARHAGALLVRCQFVKGFTWTWAGAGFKIGFGAGAGVGLSKSSPNLSAT